MLCIDQQLPVPVLVCELLTGNNLFWQLNRVEKEIINTLLDKRVPNVDLENTVALVQPGERPGCKVSLPCDRLNEDSVLHIRA